jgi:hypothetical protein
MIMRAAACGHLGRGEEGREWVDRIRAIVPDLTIAGYSKFVERFFVPDVVAAYAEGLRKAGVPEE